MRDERCGLSEGELCGAGSAARAQHCARILFFWDVELDILQNKFHTAQHLTASLSSDVHARHDYTNSLSIVTRTKGINSSSGPSQPARRAEQFRNARTIPSALSRTAAATRCVRMRVLPF